jgi:hypothetical protein
VIVIDAAAMFEMLFQTVKDTKVEQRVFASGESLQAPDLLDLEVTQVLRRNLRAMRLQFAVRSKPSRISWLSSTSDMLTMCCCAESGVCVTISPHTMQRTSLWRMIGVTLVRCDSRVASAPGNNAKVELI